MNAQVIQFPEPTINYEDFAISENTIRAYKSDWKHYKNWCLTKNQISLPSKSQTVCDYITELATLKYSHATIKRRIASIVSYHTDSDYGSPITPTVNKKLQGIGNRNGRVQTAKKAIMLKDLKLIIDAIDTSTLSGKRDKSLILLGFSTASRRSELVSIDYENLSFEQEGLDIGINLSKINSFQVKTILFTENAYCPIKSLLAWTEAANITHGAIFRSINRHGQIGERLTGESVADILKKYIGTTELDPTLYAAHSLRSGHATSAGKKNFNESSIMKQGGWKTPAIAAKYQQNGLRFENNSSSILRDL